MGRKGEETRQRILDAAQALILERGYSGVSVDHLTNGLGLTKGAFFHHFKNKRDLATTLIKRYAADGMMQFEETLSRAKRLSDDPLQQFLILIRLYEERFDGLTEPHPGCLFASYVCELQQFDTDIRPIIRQEFLLARKELKALIAQISDKYSPRALIDSIALADTFMSTFEGAFILSKALHEPEITVQQLRLYRTFVELLFSREIS